MKSTPINKSKMWYCIDCHGVFEAGDQNHIGHIGYSISKKEAEKIREQLKLGNEE